MAAGFERERYHDLDVLHRDFVDDFNVFVSLVATGALFGLRLIGSGPGPSGWPGCPSFSPIRPLPGSQQIKRTYRQTIRALARIPEVAGLGEEGHADRTANLASRSGFDLAFSRKDLDELEYAALMHDIGRITLTEPAIIRVGYTDDDIARWGAEIICEAPYLTRSPIRCASCTSPIANRASKATRPCSDDFEDGESSEFL